MATMIPTSRKESKKTQYKVTPVDRYPARLVRFVGLGVHPQRPYQGQAKPDAFKVSLQWELYNPETLEAIEAVEIKIDETTGEKSEVPTGRPSCVFQDVVLYPRAERGKVFDLYKAFDPQVKKTPAELDAYFEFLGDAAMVDVTQYESPKGSGQMRNGVNSVSAISKRDLKDLPQAKSTLVAFNPYADDHGTQVAYAMMFPFQRTILTEAKDSHLIPLAGTEAMKLEGVNDKAPADPIVDDEVPFEVEADPFKD